MPEDRSPAQQPFAYLTREEVEGFFNAIPTTNLRDRLLFDLIYRHGLRRREAAQLKLEDVQDGKIWIARVKRNGLNLSDLDLQRSELVCSMA